MKGRIVNDYLFLFLIVFLAIFINMVTYERQRESFVPLINEVYKPGLRNVRNYANDKIENSVSEPCIDLPVVVLNL